MRFECRCTQRTTGRVFVTPTKRLFVCDFCHGCKELPTKKHVGKHSLLHKLARVAKR